jgi:CHAD domain-containing protein
VTATERELKMTVAESFQMPDLDGVGDGIATHPGRPESVWTVYFDTSDLRLARWNASLRHRLGQGWTVKLPPELDGSVLVRPEITFPGDGKRPPAAAADLVRAFVRAGDLEPRARLWTTRRRTELRDEAGRLVADVFEDDVTVRDGRRLTGGFREIEVEIGDATPPSLLEELLDRFGDAGADASSPTSKYVRALGVESVEPEVRVPTLVDGATLGEVVRRALAASVVRLVVHDPIMRLDTDPEGVHQSRVATRRIRSDLVTFDTAVEPVHAAELREELGWLARILGAVRDGDVMLERMRARAEQLDADHATGAGDVVSSLAAGRARAHAALLSILRDRRYVRLLDRLVAEAREPVLSAAADISATDAIGPLVEKPWRKLAKQRKAIGKKPSYADLHQLRIRAKRLRYAAEAVAPVVGKPAKGLASAAADLQDVLGELNDAVVAERWLTSWAADKGRSRDAAAAANALAKLERADVKRLRSEWRPVWKQLAAPELRAWM